MPADDRLAFLTECHRQRIVAWTHDAAIHCNDCTADRYGMAAFNGGALDREGNEVHPVWSWDEGYSGEYCDTCHQPLD